MNYSLPYKTKQFFFALIKLSIVVGAFYFIYNKLANNGNLKFSTFFTFLNENAFFSAKNVFFLLVLSLFNWFLEILKWKQLVSTIKKISFFEATKQTLGSLTASLFTPNRIGEYGAKAIYFVNSYRKKIMLLNLVGNTLQMVVTVVFGSIGLLLFTSTYSINIDVYRILRILTLGVVIIVFFILGVKQTKYTIKGFSLNKIFLFLKNLPVKVSFLVTVFSIFRYVLFSFQFYYLLLLFGVNMHYLDAMVIITTMYLLTSIIPTLFIFDVVVKGSVAVFLFSFTSISTLTILSVITTMWILNFVIPSVAGCYFVLTFNHKKQLKP
ncbi:hypothetical protein [Lacinutrix sp. MedPE-SW]|uniref:hypothetical protein n=1 Tax=Lacinutrix sp. MedPE-SW TaxID=1860087 RepID=UPI000916BF22|nr:hypothetical protein [Lacinutrix sp. MedPE-SW]OIQ20327.1 MAG: hypothetical protein BM549_10420 [Lacinutrix sp. MedPE-SW]